MLDPVRPPIELCIAVAADVELLGAMKPAVNEIRGDVFGVGPFARGIGDNKRNIISAKQREKFWDHKCRMPDFDAMADWAGCVRLRPGAALHFITMLLRQPRGCACV